MPHKPIVKWFKGICYSFSLSSKYSVFVSNSPFLGMHPTIPFPVIIGFTFHFRNKQYSFPAISKVLPYSTITPFIFFFISRKRNTKGKFENICQCRMLLMEHWDILAVFINTNYSFFLFDVLLCWGLHKQTPYPWGINHLLVVGLQLWLLNNEQRYEKGDHKCHKGI